MQTEQVKILMIGHLIKHKVVPEVGRLAAKAHMAYEGVKLLKYIRVCLEITPDENLVALLVHTHFAYDHHGIAHKLFRMPDGKLIVKLQLVILANGYMQYRLIKEQVHALLMRVIIAFEYALYKTTPLVHNLDLPAVVGLFDEAEQVVVYRKDIGCFYLALLVVMIGFLTRVEWTVGREVVF